MYKKCYSHFLKSRDDLPNGTPSVRLFLYFIYRVSVGHEGFLKLPLVGMATAQEVPGLTARRVGTDGQFKELNSFSIWDFTVRSNMRNSMIQPAYYIDRGRDRERETERETERGELQRKQRKESRSHTKKGKGKGQTGNTISVY